MPNLPFDILFDIIEEIGTQERPDFDLLWAFCSTCRPLRPHAQKFLFQSLSFDFIANSRPHPFGRSIGISWNHVDFIVRGSPQVAVCVQYLQFRAPSSTDISPAFVSLLSKFTALRTLRCGYANQHAWHLLEAPEKRRWESVIQLPSLRTLEILDLWRIPVSVLFSCTNLQDLYFDIQSAFDEPDLEGGLNDISHLPLRNLTSIRTDWHFDFLDPLFTVYPLIGVPLVEKSSITCLSICRMWDIECRKFGQFPSLRSLSVDLSQLINPSSLFTNSNPSLLQSLDKLSMEFVWDSKFTIVFPSMVLVAALQIQDGFCSLTGVVVTLVFSWGDYPLFKDGVKGELGALDHLFASTSTFPRLHSVTVMLKFNANSLMEEVTRFWIEDTDMIDEYLPLTAARPDCTLVPLVHLSL
ncbi:hypothetical protein D9619_008509 [Psilocybe cf. subviscida]|uniref:Uncharacterized protein n=1 Tax=Psilocybe cf. subviscida TaxID=2480587 RepID=A0A8H5F0W4_9AGAR|nr:hypothetical protein D9619_008509 [Psilocybe cf. subviscida]